MLQPEMREIQKRYKGDRRRPSRPSRRLQGARDQSLRLPALLLQLPLLFIMYSVIQNGITTRIRTRCSTCWVSRS